MTLRKSNPDPVKLGDLHPGLVHTGIPDGAHLIQPEPATREPSEHLTEITGAIAGLADYIEARDAKLAAQLAAMETRTKPPASKEAHATRATAYRAAAVVASIAVVAAALVLIIWLLARTGVL